MKKLYYSLVAILLVLQQGTTLIIQAEIDLWITTWETPVVEMPIADVPEETPTLPITDTPTLPSDNQDTQQGVVIPWTWTQTPWTWTQDILLPSNEQDVIPPSEESESEASEDVAQTTFSRKRIPSSTEKCVTFSASSGAEITIDRGDNVQNVIPWEGFAEGGGLWTGDLHTICHTYPDTIGIPTYEVNLEIAHSCTSSSSAETIDCSEEFPSLDLSNQQIISFSGNLSLLSVGSPLSGETAKLEGLVDNCIDTSLLDTGLLLQLDEQFSGRATTQGVCIGNLITKGINTHIAFGRLQLWGNEEKKAELTTTYRYTIGHMFSENEVYTFDLSGVKQEEILNLPTPPTFNAKAIKLWFLRQIAVTEEEATEHTASTTEEPMISSPTPAPEEEKGLGITTAEKKDVNFGVVPMANEGCFYHAGSADGGYLSYGLSYSDEQKKMPCTCTANGEYCLQSARFPDTTNNPGFSCGKDITCSGFPVTYTWQERNCGSCQADSGSCGTGHYSCSYECRSSEGSWVSDGNCTWSKPSPTSYTCNAWSCYTAPSCNGSWSNPSPSWPTAWSVNFTYNWDGVYWSNYCSVSTEGGTCSVQVCNGSDGYPDCKSCSSSAANNIDKTGPNCNNVSRNYTVDSNIITLGTRTNKTVRTSITNYSSSDAKNNPVTLQSSPDYCDLTTSTMQCSKTLVDNLGNPSICTKTYPYIDTVVSTNSPACTITYNPAIWPVNEVEIGITCPQDAQSPIHYKNLSWTTINSSTTPTSSGMVYNNGDYTFEVRDDAGNTGTFIATVDRIWIDYRIRYNPWPDGSKPNPQENDPPFTGHRTPTSGDVEVHITVDETGVVLDDCKGNVLTSGRYNAYNDDNNLPAGKLWTSTGFTFTAPYNSTGSQNDNKSNITPWISYQLCYTNKDGVTGVILPEVYRIDKDPPSCTITYDPPQPAKDASGNYLNPADEYVMAHLDCTDYSDRRVTNNDGSQDYLFTENGEFDFRVIDEAGNVTGAHAGLSGDNTKAIVDWIIPRRTISYNPPESWGLTSWNVDVTITMSRSGVTLTYWAVHSGGISTGGTTGGMITGNVLTGNDIVCPEGFMINTGTTPVLPQSIIDDFWSGMAVLPPPKFECYPTTNSGGSIKACVWAPWYMQPWVLWYWKPIHPGVLPENELSPLLSWSDIHQARGCSSGTRTSVTLTGTTYTFTVPQDGRYFFTYSGSRKRGSTGEIPTTVTRIDKIPPLGKVTYNPNSNTAGTVTATLTLSESGTVPWRTKVNEMTRTKVYANNIQEYVKFYDLAGNAAIAPISITRIYHPGGWGGGSLKQDNCPNGDDSPSLYDGTCSGGAEHWTAEKCSIEGSKYTTEENEGYLFACERDITTMRTIQKARIHDGITRAEMAKIISVYATKILGREVPNKKPQCREFKDLNLVNAELQAFITIACEIEQMGYRANGVDFLTYFRPNDKISRAEVWIIISRMLRGTRYAGTENYRYQSHLSALKTKEIMNYTDNPMMRELRGNVFIMLHRLYDKGYVKSTSGTTSSLEDFMQNQTARTTGYTETASLAKPTSGAQNFTVIAQSSGQKEKPIDFMVSAMKGISINTAYTGKVFVSVPELTSQDYTIVDKGIYDFDLTDKGRKVFAKGLTINKTGVYTIKATNANETIVGTHKILIQ